MSGSLGAGSDGVSAIARAQREQEKRLARDLEKDRRKEEKRAAARQAKRAKLKGGGDDGDGDDDGDDKEDDSPLTVNHGGMEPSSENLGMRMYKTVEVLKRGARGVFVTPQEIFDATRVDPTEEDLAEALAANEYVRTNPRGALLYEPPHKAGSTEDLKQLLAGHPHGMKLADVEKTYSKAKRDIEKLVEAGDFVKLQNKGTRAWMLYAAPGLGDPEPMLKVSGKVMALWEEIPAPKSNKELHDKLKEMGQPVLGPEHLPTGGKASSKRKKKGKGRSKEVQMRSNAHLDKSEFAVGLKNREKQEENR